MPARRRRSWVVPAVLALLSATSGAVAYASAAGGVPAKGQEERTPTPVTPVLSARRVPDLLSRTVAQVRLGTALDEVMTAPALGGATDASCLTVEEGETTIYTRGADRSLVPASTLKVLTGMAALRRLGASFHFVTEARTARPPAGGVVDGPLWLVGAGDPLLATHAYAASFRNQPQVFTSLDKLADDIVAAGISEIRGGVIGDESRFDTERYVGSWKPGYITDHEIGPVSALVVNDNFTQFRPKPMIAATAPAVHGAAVLTELLRGRGVVVADPSAGVAPADAKPVAAATSPPLPDVVGQMLRESDNMTAEVLTKEMGKRFGGAGTWPAGIAAVRATVAEAGLPASGYEAVDGSGLDVSNRLSCAVLMDALDLAGPASPVAGGFAVAGVNGTLANRFKGNPAEGKLRAKTGSLNFVSGLVGFVDAGSAAETRTLEFALLANALPDRSATGRAVQEQVGAILSQYPQAPAAGAIGPEQPRAAPPPG